MPRYFFQLIDQGDTYRDTEGQELVDAEAARYEAALIAAELARDALPKGDLVHSVEVIVYDEQGKQICRNRLIFETIVGPPH